MRSAIEATLCSVLIGSAACYHAVIDTGRPAGNQTIERPWASSFIGGLIPPAVVETASRCPNGVARVETQHSFLNWLVGAITFGIYTPMEIRVTCAAAGTSSLDAGQTIVVGGRASVAEKLAGLTEAVARAVATDSAVFVRF
jgi:hypothetical protein